MSTRSGLYRSESITSKVEKRKKGVQFLKIVKNMSTVPFEVIIGLRQTALVAKKVCPVYLTFI